MRGILMRCPDHLAVHPRHAAWIGRTILAWIAVLAAIVLAPASAFAAGSAKAVAIYVEGNDADTVRGAVLSIVPERLRIIDPAVFSDALGKEGQRGSFGPALTQARQREKALGRLRKAAAAVGADAVIAARSRKNGPGGLVVAVMLLDQIPGDLAVDEDVTLPSGSDAKKAALSNALGSHLEQLAGPKAESKAVATKTTDTPVAPPPVDASPSREKNQMSTALFTASLSFEIGGRRFAYSDPITPNTRDYDVFGAPMPAVAVEVYPGAGTRIPLLKDLGLTGSFSRAFGISSATKSGTKLGTTWMRAGGGLRARFRPGSNEGPVIGVDGGISFTSFTFDGSATLATSTPDVSYVALRGGLDARIPFWRMALLLDAGYDGALSAGAVHDRFKGPTVGGLDAGAGFAILIASGFEARLTGRYTRYFYSFDPVPGDAYVAGGALDELFSFGIGVAYAY
ncbi:MAG: hypothetical protein ABJE95_02830 [Byssovorax sp.]